MVKSRYGVVSHLFEIDYGSLGVVKNRCRTFRTIIVTVYPSGSLWVVTGLFRIVMGYTLALTISNYIHGLISVGRSSDSNKKSAV